MSSSFITSDLHIDHKKVIEFNDRPFTSVEEMRDALLEEINALPPNATLYVLGDTVVRGNRESLRWFLNRIRRDIKLVWVLGNHDDGLESVFADYGQVNYLLHLKHGDKAIVMCHYPLTEWRRGQHGAIHFFGHCHGRFEHHGKSLDVGWDVHRRILSLDEAIAMADAKPIFQPCHDQHNGLLTTAEKG